MPKVERRTIEYTRRRFLARCGLAVAWAAGCGEGQTMTERDRPQQESSPAQSEAHRPTALVHDPVCLQHDTGPGHPERPQRYEAVLSALRGADFADGLLELSPQDATDDDLFRCHDSAYVALAKRDIASGARQLSTGDTAICPDTLEPALKAAGAACTAVDAVMEGRVRNAFSIMRPPGHHATPDRGMGFCVFSNVAVAARYAQAQHGIGRVLVVDWDVHHGNGTQDVFYQDGSVFFFSTHQWPWYPGTGPESETGAGNGEGTTMNRPFPSGSGRDEILGAFENDLLPAMQDFRPEFVFVSAGFDSRLGDPLGEFRLTDEDFADLTGLVLQIADEYAEGRVVSCLEGGYALDGLASAAAAHCGRLVER